MQQRWIQLAHKCDSFYSKPMVSGSNEIIMVPTSKTPNKKYLYKYSFQIDDISPWIPLPAANPGYAISTTFNDAKQLLYIIRKAHPTDNDLIVLDLETKQFASYNTKIYHHNKHVQFSSIIVNDELHLIGLDMGVHFKMISIMNTKKLIRLGRLKACFENRLNTVIYLKSANSLLSFGGYDGFMDNASWLDCIQLYSTGNDGKNEWELLENKLPQKMCAFGCVVLNNERDVVIFGGETPNGDSDEIYVLSLETMDFKQCKLKCPMKSKFNAVIVDNFENHQLVVGYVKDLWRMKKFANIIYPPKEVINIIQRYYYNQEIHLFADKSHWKVNVDDILNNVSLDGDI